MITPQNNTPEQNDDSSENPSDDLEIDIRLATSKDMAELVIPSWLQSYARSLVAKLMRADSRYGMGRDLYWSSQRKRIETILSSQTTRVLVASISGINVGWACEDRRNNTLHYVYVKDNFRRQGVGRKLVGWINETKDLVRLTHLPPPWYSRPVEGGRNLWEPHIVIDLITC